MNMRILVAEDDPRLRSVLERALKENGYAVDAVADGQEALSYLRAYDYAVMVLDWRMPKMSGIELLRQARARHVATPVLILTAKDTTADRVTGLDTGADDYLVKPFQLAELLARIRALLRRPGEPQPPRLTCADVWLDGTAAAVADRLAVATGRLTGPIAQTLLNDRHAVLGITDMLVHPRGTGVQWNPADHLCMAGQALCRQAPGGTWTLMAGMKATSKAKTPARAATTAANCPNRPPAAGSTRTP